MPSNSESKIKEGSKCEKAAKNEQLLESKDDEDKSRDLNSLYLKKNADFHFLFRNIPINEMLFKDYGCALQRDILTQGRLYVTENYLCFYSNIFGWITKIVINLEEVISIEKKMTALIIPNAMEISTLHTRRFFASFISRDSAYMTVYSLWQKVKNRTNNGLHTHNNLSLLDFSQDDQLLSKNRNVFHEANAGDLLVHKSLQRRSSDLTINKKSIENLKSMLVSDSKSAENTDILNSHVDEEKYMLRNLKLDMFTDEIQSDKKDKFSNNNLSKKSLKIKNFSVSGIFEKDLIDDNTELTDFDLSAGAENNSLPQQNLLPTSKSQIISKSETSDDTSSLLKKSFSAELKTPNTHSYQNNLVNNTEPQLVSLMDTVGTIYSQTHIDDREMYDNQKIEKKLSQIDFKNDQGLSFTKNISNSQPTEIYNESEELMLPTSCPCSDPNSTINIKKHQTNISQDVILPIPLPLAAKLILFGLPIPQKIMKKHRFDSSSIEEDELNNWMENFFVKSNMKNVTIGAWTDQILTDSETPLLVSYDKPLNIPIGPKQTHSMESIYILYKDFDKAVVVETIVRTPDVPSGNSFEIKVRTCLTWAGNDEACGGMTRLLVTCDVEWLKSSWLKKQIESGSKDGIKQTWTSIANDIIEWADNNPKLKTKVNAKHNPQNELSKSNTFNGANDDQADGFALKDTTAESMFQLHDNQINPIGLRMHDLEVNKSDLKTRKAHKQEKKHFNKYKTDKNALNLSFIAQLKKPMIRWLGTDENVIPASVSLIFATVISISCIFFIKSFGYSIMSGLVEAINFTHVTSSKNSGEITIESIEIHQTSFWALLNSIVGYFAKILSVFISAIRKFFLIFGFDFEINIDSSIPNKFSEQELVYLTELKQLKDRIETLQELMIKTHNATMKLLENHKIIQV
ncbi:hypothetical protein BB561_002204 [Smittium simulii]|uniref:VASt domain-containing protein n=1 Tax=Smittium simulii TaxID=133385 RepID=A0A2T9YRA9_9FUNG|nr:hypothetical protein BB561_002204 [Smittium simulii]